jgi:hypothetical protein
LAAQGAPRADIEQALDKAMQTAQAMGAELLLQRSTAQRQALSKTASSDSTQIQR